ncbi:hypothetical protein ADK38_44680, partial [Streptomyces varsoviensis]
PLTAAGKVDRRALIELRDEAARSGDDSTVEAAALTPIQEAVADVWAQSLGREVSGPDADFFALGGHSLLALAVVDDLREDLGVELSLTDFFASPTVAGHAALIERALLAAHATVAEGGAGPDIGAAGHGHGHDTDAAGSGRGTREEDTDGNRH